MKLLGRILSSLLLWGSVSLAVARWKPTLDVWVFALAGVLFAWRVCKELFLARYRLQYDDESFVVRAPNLPPRTAAYRDLCRVEIIYPRFIPREWLFKTRYGVAAGETYTVPSGFRRSQMLRRWWTLSPDLFLQPLTGPPVLFPLSALDTQTSLDFRARLVLRAPEEAFERDQGRLKNAISAEEKGDQALRDRRWAEAVCEFRFCAEQWEQLHQQDGLLRCLAKLSESLQLLDRMVEAAAVAVRRLNLATESRDPVARGDALNDLARVERNIGEEAGMKSALEHLREAADLYRSAGMRFHQARMFSNSAIISEQMYQVIMASGRREAAVVHLDCAGSFARQAIKALEQEQTARGVPEEELAIQMANARGTVARCLFHRAEGEGSIEERPTWQSVIDAFTAARKLIPQTRGAIPEDDAMWGHALFRASLADGLGEGERLRLQHQAMEKVDEAIRSLPLLGDLSITTAFLGIRGGLFWAQGNLEAACRDYEAVVSLVESRPFGFSRPFEFVIRRSHFREIYTRLVEGYLRRSANAEHCEALVEKAFEYSERGKARSLRDLLWSTEFMSMVSGDLRTELEAAQREQQTAFLAKMDGNSFPPAEQRAEQLQRMAQAEERLSRAFHRAFAMNPEMELAAFAVPPSLGEVRNQLPRNGRAAVLEMTVCEGGLAVFLISPKVDPARSWAFLENCNSSNLDNDDLLNSFLVAYNWYGAIAEQMRDAEFELWRAEASGAPENEMVGLRQRSSELSAKAASQCESWMLNLRSVQRKSDQLISDIEILDTSIPVLLEKLDVATLTIIPDGVLNRLPLHTAFPSRIATTLCPSCDVMLRVVRRARRRPGNMLLIDNPDGSLPLASKGADAISAMVKAAGLPEPCRLPPAEDRTGEFHASMPEWILARMQDFSWLHIGAHAKSNLEHPWRSYLALGIPPLTGLEVSECWERQFLRASRIAAGVRVPTGGSAFTLGCSTGVLPKNLAGEFSGLPAAMLASGYVVVIGTLWDVPEGTAVLLANRFYERYLLHNEGVPAALSHAAGDVRSMQLDDIRQCEKQLQLSAGSILSDDAAETFPPEHPVHWAAFVVWGAGWCEDEVPADTTAHRSVPAVEASPFLQTAPAELAQSITEAAYAFQGDRLQDAIRILTAALAKWGPSFQLNSRLADVYSALNDIDRACHHEKIALSFDPNSFRGYYNLGCEYRELGKIEQAQECFEAAIRLNPGYAKALGNLAQLTNDPRRALQLMRRAASIDPLDEDYTRAVSMWEDLAGDASVDMAAQRIYWATGALNQKHFKEAHMQIALALQSAEKPAVQALAYSVQSDILRQEGDIRRSIQALERAVSRDSSVASYWNNLAARRLIVAQTPATTSGERTWLFEETLMNAQRAIEANDYARPHQNLANAHFSLGQFPDAQRQALIALEMSSRQIMEGAHGRRICIGCPTEAQMPAECRECRTKAEGLLRDLDLASGRYRV